MPALRTLASLTTQRQIAEEVAMAAAAAAAAEERAMVVHHTPATATAIEKNHINFYNNMSIGNIAILHSNNFLLSIIYVLCNLLII
jgi:hypothetical protein